MGEFTAFCTIVLLGNIGAPPTSGSFLASAVAVMQPSARHTAAVDVSNVLMILFMTCSSLQNVGFAVSRGRDRERPSSLRPRRATGLHEIRSVPNQPGCICVDK